MVLMMYSNRFEEVNQNGGDSYSSAHLSVCQRLDNSGQVGLVWYPRDKMKREDRIYEGFG
jgi:hypothetical protein